MPAMVGGRGRAARSTTGAAGGAAGISGLGWARGRDIAESSVAEMRDGAPKFGAAVPVAGVGARVCGRPPPAIVEKRREPPALRGASLRLSVELTAGRWRAWCFATEVAASEVGQVGQAHHRVRLGHLRKVRVLGLLGDARTGPACGACFTRVG